MQDFNHMLRNVYQHDLSEFTHTILNEFTLTTATSVLTKPAQWLRNKPFIAVVMAATAKHVLPQDFEHMALAKLMLPSLLKTVASDQYHYEMFVGVDDDDTFWMDPKHQSELQRRAGALPVHIHGFSTPEHHIPLNEILKVARDAGAEYLVRINDDTEFMTSGWTALGVNKLASYHPPNVGVVGPMCRQGNSAILTHDMVHRTHMDIFRDEYYPDVFHNWWLDDWITGVYGSRRTTKLATWVVKHHTGHHGTRYEVDPLRKVSLEDELARGKGRVAAWLQTRSEAVPTSYSDVYGPAKRSDLRDGSLWDTGQRGTYLPQCELKLVTTEPIPAPIGRGERRYIMYALYGKVASYWGRVRNILRQGPKVFPGWRMRFHVPTGYGNKLPPEAKAQVQCQLCRPPPATRIPFR